MRIFTAVLAVMLILLQGRLWFSDRGLREVSGLRASVEARRAANLEQTERNRQLSAEVANLKTGLTALEERARSELGMVAASETFYQVVRANTPAPAAPARPRAQGRGARPRASRPSPPRQTRANAAAPGGRPPFQNSTSRCWGAVCSNGRCAHCSPNHGFMASWLSWQTAIPTGPTWRSGLIRPSC